MAKSEGQKVREAYDGPKVEHDALIDQIEQRSKEEYARGSDAAESGAKVKEFLDETGLNSQAFSWGKSIMKKLPKKDGQAKAMDVIRSLEVILPMLKNHIGGQGTAEMSLPEPEAKPEPAEPMTDADVEALASEMDDADANIEHVQFGDAS
jgi:hypothetical protein